MGGVIYLYFFFILVLNKVEVRGGFEGFFCKGFSLVKSGRERPRKRARKIKKSPQSFENASLNF